jgi:hypothetical protein
MKDEHRQRKTCQHSHEKDPGATAEEMLQFFSCCLGEKPPEISAKLRQLRQKIPGQNLEQVSYEPGKHFKISKEMIVADLVLTFPALRPHLEELHPLGMLSPMLASTTLEMLLSDLDVNPQQVCRELENIINPQ